MKFEYRDYQRECIEKCTSILRERSVCYLASQPRTGKTLMSLKIISRKNLNGSYLIVTTGKARGDIKKDIKTFEKNSPEFTGYFVVETYHQAYKHITAHWDGVILDEAHNLKAYNQDHQLGKIQGEIKRLLNRVDGWHLFMSGTPAPENELGYYRQFWCSKHHWWSTMSWSTWHNIYASTRWDYIKKLDREIPTHTPKAEKILNDIAPLVVTMSQKDAGFDHQIIEHKIIVPMDKSIFHIGKAIMQGDCAIVNGKVFMSTDFTKKRTLMHQLCGGILTQDGQVQVVCYQKAEWILQMMYTGKRLAVYHYFQEEGKLLRRFLDGFYTDDIEEFDRGHKAVFIGQVKKDSCGVRLASADALVVYSCDYSATNFLQWRDRLVFLGRKQVDIYWLFNDQISVDQAICNALTNKKSYTLKMFENEQIPKPTNKLRMI